MPLDERLRPILDAANSLTAADSNPVLSVGARRDIIHAGLEASMLAFTEPGPEPASITDFSVSVKDGQIDVRAFIPHGPGPFPAHMYMHGGGWWIGTIDHFKSPCREVSADAACVVLSVGYRLAPEHKFPTLTEDCYAALLWLVSNAETLNVDRKRISVGGASAGGNLAAVVAQMARDRDGPDLVLQVLQIPTTDLVNDYPSARENAKGYLLTSEAMEFCRELYLENPADAHHPYASPLLAEDLSGLPPALIITAELDPLRDEGEAYARALQSAGVPATLWCCQGQIHGCQNWVKVLPELASANRSIIATRLRAAYSCAQ